MAASEVRRLIQNIVGDMTNLPIHGVVTAVDGETCSVLLVGGLVVSDVRLKATVTGNKRKVLLTPKIGSEVMMISSDTSVANLTVVSIDEVDKIEIVTEDISIIVDDKVSVLNDNFNLAQVLSDLCDLLKTFQVTTPVGPSMAVLTTTIAKIDQVEKGFKSLLK